VVPDPELSGFIPSKRDQFLIIATDGLWDVMTSQRAVEFVNDLLVEDDLLGIFTSFLYYCDALLFELPRHF